MIHRSIHIIGSFVKKKWLALTIILWSLICFLSLYPLPELPEIPGKDKTLHIVAYAALAFPASWAKPKNLILVLLFFVVFSGGLELIQPFVNRYGEWEDLMANSSGIVLGFLVARLFSYWLKPPVR